MRKADRSAAGPVAGPVAACGANVYEQLNYRSTLQVQMSITEVAYRDHVQRKASKLSCTLPVVAVPLAALSLGRQRHFDAASCADCGRAGPTAAVNLGPALSSEVRFRPVNLYVKLSTSRARIPVKRALFIISK
jgi:hypothetical protein